MNESRSLADQLGTAWRRRRKQIIILFAVAFVASAAVIWKLKPTYRATAVVVIDDTTPPPEYVRTAVTGDAESKLRALRERLLGHGTLAAVVQEHNLYPEAAKLGMAARVDRLRKHLDIKVEAGSAVNVTYETEVKDKAAPVVNRLAEQAMQVHAAARVTRAQETVSYLKNQLSGVEPSLLDAEKKLRHYRLAHKGSLPEEVESNLREMDQSRLLMGRTQEVLSALTARRRTFMLDRQRGLRRDEDELGRQLLEARARYTADHPELKRLEGEHAAAVGRRKAEEKKLALAIRSSTEVLESDKEIADLKAAMNQLNRKAQLHAERVGKTAKISDELAVLVFNYNSLRERHGGLKTRLFEAELALGLEDRSKAARGALVSRAQTPAEPSRPNKQEMLVLALFGSLLFSIAVAVLRESLDRSVRDPGEVRAAFGGVPVLACVPRIGGRVRQLTSSALPALPSGSGGALVRRPVG